MKTKNTILLFALIACSIISLNASRTYGKRGKETHRYHESDAHRIAREKVEVARAEARAEDSERRRCGKGYCNQKYVHEDKASKFMAQKDEKRAEERRRCGKGGCRALAFRNRNKDSLSRYNH